MAQGQTAVRISEQRVLGAKIEATANSAESLGSSDASFWVHDPKIEPNIAVNELQGNGLSHPGAVSGARAGKATFKIPLYGGGTNAAPTWATTFLPGCGLAQSGTTGTFTLVAPNSSNAATLTIGLWTDGVRQQISGSQGTYTLGADNSGNIVFVNFDFDGVYNAEADNANPSPTLPSVPPITFMGFTNTIGGHTPAVNKFMIDGGNKVYLLQDGNTGNGTNGTGYRGAVLTDRLPKVTLDPELRLLATRDYMAKLIAGTTEAYSITMQGVGAGNTVTIAAPAARTVKAGISDRSGVATRDIELRLGRSAAEGDEYTLTFS